ncbi:tetraacyldisaccharide 4'-kinase [bacterium]|nr:tetraacyldisaccharide 4'-kinase [bacterium]
MKIYEKYSLAEKIFIGKGIWKFFLPARFVLSLLFSGWLSLTGLKPAVHTKSLNTAGDGFVNSSDSPRVISIGNLVMGGGGKTPCALALAKEIKKKCGRPVVVTRGYGSMVEKSGKTIVISSDRIKENSNDYLTDADYLGDEGQRLSERLFAKTFGDEVSIYRDEGIDIVIDVNRKRGVKLAEEILNPTDIILDDAYQNNSLKKDIDILLLDYDAPFANGRIMPMGMLREKPEAIKRADVIIFTRVEGDRIPSEVLKFAVGKRIFYSRHEFSVIYGHVGKIIRPDALRHRKVVLYSGIAFPASFEEMVTQEICIPAASFRYSDHHPYTHEDIESMITKVGKDACFLTTEKDWFKTNELFPDQVEVFAVKMEMVIKGIDEFLMR